MGRPIYLEFISEIYHFALLLSLNFIVKVVSVPFLANIFKIKIRGRKELKRKFYVIINQNGFVKATKTEGAVKAKEIQVQVNLDIPDKAFSKPQFEANLTIREDQLPDIVQELDIELLRLKESAETEEI